ncbi:unnamed protein product, partial [Mesorhabditis spiculigera]
MDPIDISYYPKIYSIFQWVSVPTTFVNLLGLYVIWFGTPKRIGNYKNYMCYLQINAILYDLILVYLIFPICAIPAGGCFSMGVLPKFGITAWVQMSLGFGIMTSFLAAIAIAFFSRQQAILDEGHRLKFSKRTGKLVCILIALHPLYYVVPAGLCILMLNDEQQAHAYHYVTHPIVKNFISQPSYYALEAKMRFITVPAATIYNSVVFYGFIYLIVPSYLQIQSFKVATTSRKTLKMQRRWLNSLLVQTATFYFIYMFPAFCLFDMADHPIVQPWHRVNDRFVHLLWQLSKIPLSMDLANNGGDKRKRSGKDK